MVDASGGFLSDPSGLLSGVQGSLPHGAALLAALPPLLAALALALLLCHVGRRDSSAPASGFGSRLGTTYLLGCACLVAASLANLMAPLPQPAMMLAPAAVALLALGMAGRAWGGTALALVDGSPAATRAGVEFGAEGGLGRARLARRLEHTPLALIEVEALPGQGLGKIRGWSDRAEAIFGWNAREAVGRRWRTLRLTDTDAVGPDGASLTAAALAAEDRQAAVSVHCRHRHGAVRQCRFYLSVETLDATGCRRIEILIEDMTEQVRAAADLFRLAHYDALTGLPNRRHFLKGLDEALVRLRSDDRRALVMIIDLENFAEVNDVFGHDSGDEVLSTVGARLRRLAGRSGMCARLGGDEFAIALWGYADDATAVGAGHEIIRSLDAPFHRAGRRLELRARVGIALGPNDGASAVKLLRAAGTALLRVRGSAHGERRSRHAFFSPEVENELRSNRLVQRGLRTAIEQNSLRLVYQPVINLADERVVQVEALARWPQSEGPDIPPATFIPIAEANDLILPLGAWVINEACRQAAVWHSAGIKRRVSVNVSAAQLRRPDIIEEIRRALRSNELPPSCLEIEVTESIFLDPSKDVIMTVLKRLTGLGVTLAIDDFGTGYSSLAYLKYFPFHKVKIDRSFVMDIGRDGQGEAILGSIITLARRLGKLVVAEGVETAGQLAYLRAQGCDLAQGYFLGHPQSATMLERALPATPPIRYQPGFAALNRSRA